MAANSPIPFVATHIESIQDMPSNLELLAIKTKNQNLNIYAEEWRRVISQLQSLEEPYTWESFPGVLKWWRKPTQKIDQVLYLIWKNPWMAVSKDTFIGSVLTSLGLKKLLVGFSEKYPKIELSDYSPKNTLLLFSSEPYDFAKEMEPLIKMDYPCALVDGASFSWFGLRSLRFLQEVAMRKKA